MSRKRWRGVYSQERKKSERLYRGREMWIKIMETAHRLIGNPGYFTFEKRIFNFVILLGICMTAFGTIMDVFYQVNILIDLAFIGCWILTYYLSRFKNCFNAVSIISMGIFVFVFFPYNWIASGGSRGILPYYSVLFIAIVCIIFKGCFRVAMVLSVLAVVLLLIRHDASSIGTFSNTFLVNMNLFDLSVHLCVILAAMSILIIVYSNTYMKEKARSEAYARAIEEQYQQQIYYMENLEQLIYKLKSERHDFNNHLGVIYGLLSGGETDKAGGYVMQLVKTAEEYQSIVSIPYSMLRAMLNYKLSAAREGKIELRLNINLPDKLRLNEFDLAVILGNLLDNAAEACAKVTEGSRYIGLNILYKPDYLIIQVENPVNQDAVLKDGKSRTTKSDAENHGFGLNNVEYLVAKYYGLMKTESKEGVFEVNIALLAGN
jgi:sensor histidine kinase YesM